MKGSPVRAEPLAVRYSHLTILEEGRLIVLAHKSGNGPITLTLEIGSVHDPRKTASGRVLLSQLPEEEVGYQISKAVAHFGEMPEATLNLFRPGVSVQWAEDETIAGLVDAAILIPLGQRLNAALTCTTFRTQLCSQKRDLIEQSLRLQSDCIAFRAGAM